VIKLSLPKAKSDTRAKQTVVVSINPSQQFFVGTHPVLKDSLRAAIEPLLKKETDSEPTIVINADKTANAESIVDVMKVASSLKVRAVLAIDQD
jgi:biopolymer transport protein ExbD